MNSVVESNSLLDSPSPLQSDDYPGLDFGSYDESLEGDNGKRRNRGASTAERRATHNAVERARRETLNTRFQELAVALPNMANVKRPSKSAIVNKSIEYVQTSQDRERALQAQNDALRAEVNDLRARLGLGPVTPVTASIKLPTARPREQSISSIHTIDSPLLSGSPPASFDSTTFNPTLLTAQLAYSPASSNGDRRLSGDELRVPSPTLAVPDIKSVQQTAVAPQPALSNPQSAFAMSALGAAELGYWMGLQQPQTNPLVSAFMNMQTGHHMAGMPTWQTPFPHMPVSAGAGGDAMNWLFA